MVAAVEKLLMLHTYYQQGLLFVIVCSVLGGFVSFQIALRWLLMVLFK